MDSKNEVVSETDLNMKFDSEISDDLLKLDDNKLCESCEIEKKPAIKCCNDCEIHLCKVCSSYHDKFKATKAHKVENIEPEVQWTCDKHKENTTDRYCVQCNEACCSKCSEEEHGRHDFETSETIINYIKDFKNYLKYLDKIKLDITANSNSVCDQIDENSEMLITKIQYNSHEMKKKVEACKDENIDEIIEYENKIKLAINQLVNMKNNFIKRRKILFQNQITEGEPSANVVNKESIDNKDDDKIEKDVSTSDTDNCSDAKDDNSTTSIPEKAASDKDTGDEENYRSIKSAFEHFKIKYTLEARLYRIDLELGLSYNSMLTTKLVRRIPVPACRLMSLDQPSNRLFVVSHGVHTFSLDDFQETEHTNIPLYGDINDCTGFQSCILFSRVNESFINAYSFDLKTDEKLHMKLYVSKMNFVPPSLIICIDGLQSSASIFRINNQESESKTASYSARLLHCIKGEISGELLLDCVLFDDINLLGCFYSENTKSSQLKFIGIQRKGSAVVCDKQYPIRNVLLKHDSKNVVMVRDKVNKLTIVSEGNKLIFFSDDFESTSRQIEFVKVGDIDLEEYNVNEPVKIACDEEKSRLFVMSKTNQEVMIFEYEVECTEYILEN